LVKDTNNPWPGNNMLFTATFKNLSGCVNCFVPTDLVLTFIGDTNPSDSPLELDPNQCQAVAQEIAPHGPPAVDYVWTFKTSFASGGVDQAQFGPLSSSASIFRDIYANVQNNYVNTTITSLANISSAQYGLSVSATVQTFILVAAPTSTPLPTSTPVAQMGKIVAWPQPAKDTICFSYESPVAGKVSIDIYNAAFQLVSHVTDNAHGNEEERSCGSITKLAPGVYFYKTSVGSFNFSTSEFGVVR
jgi:hypothetical protein